VLETEEVVKAILPVVANNHASKAGRRLEGILKWLLSVFWKSLARVLPVKQKVKEDSSTGLFVFFGLCRPCQMVVTVLKVVLGVLEGWTKECWRVAVGQ
jgi:hypothetical protein